MLFALSYLLILTYTNTIDLVTSASLILRLTYYIYYYNLRLTKEDNTRPSGVLLLGVLVSRLQHFTYIDLY